MSTESIEERIKQAKLVTAAQPKYDYEAARQPVARKYQQWMKEPDEREFLLHAMTETEVAPSFAYRVAAVMARKLPLQMQQHLAHHELSLESARQKLLRQVVTACLGLIIMAVLTLCLVTIAGLWFGKPGGPTSDGGGQNPQMLLTVFTTVFAFLTGRFMFQLGDRRVLRRNHQRNGSHDTKPHHNPASNERRTNED